MIKITTLNGAIFYRSELTLFVDVIPEIKHENGNVTPEVTMIQFSANGQIARVRVSGYEAGMTELVQIQDLPMWQIEGFTTEEEYLDKREFDDAKNKEILDAKRAEDLKVFNKKLARKNQLKTGEKFKKKK
jgi:hypothetical protein